METVSLEEWRVAHVVCQWYFDPVVGLLCSVFTSLYSTQLCVLGYACHQNAMKVMPSTSCGL